MNLINKKGKTGFIVKAGLIGALYAALTMSLPFMSYGNVQLRVSEALTILPLFFPESILGLFVGCLISNIIGNGILDVVLGSIATLISACLTYATGKLIKNDFLKMAVGGFFPVIVNAAIVPFTYLAISQLKELYWLNFLSVFIGQFVAVYVFGSILFVVIKRAIKSKALKR